MVHKFVDHKFVYQTFCTYYELINAAKTISFVDCAYIYDNSVDNQLPRILFRTNDGKLVKQYTDDIPEWVSALIIKESKPA